jgi:hypothetical protein
LVSLLLVQFFNFLFLNPICLLVGEAIEYDLFGDGSMRCKANCPCTSADDAERGHGAAAAVGHPAMPNGRCRMHGGNSPGAPRGNKSALKHGHYTAEAIAQRCEISDLLRAMNGNGRLRPGGPVTQSPSCRMPICLTPRFAWRVRNPRI